MFRDDPAWGSCLPSELGWLGSCSHTGQEAHTSAGRQQGRNWTSQHVFKAHHLHAPAHGQELESSQCPQNQGKKNANPHVPPFQSAVFLD